MIIRSLSAVRLRSCALGISNKRNYWTDEEIELLKKYYPIYGSKCAQYIPNRSEHQCGIKAGKLDIKAINSPQDRMWTEEEIELLKKYYPLYGSKCAKYIPGRSEKQCREKAISMNITVNNGHCKWSEEEIELLKKYYPIYGSKCAKYIPGRSEKHCLFKANRMHINSNVARNIWTEEENQILRTYYPIEGSKVSERLPGRTPKSIRTQTYRLGIVYLGQRSEYIEENEN